MISALVQDKQKWPILRFEVFFCLASICVFPASDFVQLEGMKCLQAHGFPFEIQTSDNTSRQSPTSIQCSFVMSGFPLNLTLWTRPQGSKVHWPDFLSVLQDQEQESSRGRSRKQKERDGCGGEARREEQQLHRPLLPVCGGKQHGHADMSLASF